MGMLVEIIGEAGSGKSTSFRNFKAGEVGVLNVLGKPLPFRNRLTVANHVGYQSIIKALQANTLKAYIIDDAGYLLTFDEFSRITEKGYEKWSEFAANFWQLCDACTKTDEDTIVYLIMHSTVDEATRRVKPKTIGKMIDQKINLEGLAPVVLFAERTDEGYVFHVKTDGYTPAKTPYGLYDTETVPNDLKRIDTDLREFYGMAPLGATDEDDEKKEE